MSVEEVDQYLRGVDEPKRITLETVRRTILEVIPEAEECISYRIPAFRVDGNVVAGIAAFERHLSYLPFSGSVLGKLADELEGYTMTRELSALPFGPSATQATGAEPDRSPPRRDPRATCSLSQAGFEVNSRSRSSLARSWPMWSADAERIS